METCVCSRTCRTTSKPEAVADLITALSIQGSHVLRVLCLLSTLEVEILQITHNITDLVLVCLDVGLLIGCHPLQAFETVCIASLCVDQLLDLQAGLIS